MIDSLRTSNGTPSSFASDPSSISATSSLADSHKEAPRIGTTFHIEQENKTPKKESPSNTNHAVPLVRLNNTPSKIKLSSSTLKASAMDDLIPNYNQQQQPNIKIRKMNERQSKYKKQQPWKKLLWYKQDYEDNYTDSSFLSQLKRNSTVINYSYWKLLNDFTLIVLHLSIIMSVILVFYGIYKLDWNPMLPTLISTSITMIGFIIYVITLKIRRNRELINLQKLKIEQLSTFTRNSRFNLSRSSRPTSRPTSRSTSPFNTNTHLHNQNKTSSASHNNNNSSEMTTTVNDLERFLTEPNPPNLTNTMKSSILILLTLLTFSPVLKSLTNSTSSDSIWALSAWLCILNVMFNDYSIDFTSHNNKHHDGGMTVNNGSGSISTWSGGLEMQSSSANLSKNISLSNAIVLASRLNSNLSAFCFIVFSIQVSGLFPIFNNFTRRCQFWSFHWFQVFGIVVGVDFTIYKIFGVGWFSVWLSIHFLIIVLGPWYFIVLQKYKDELQGPWDPAKPIVKNSL